MKLIDKDELLATLEQDIDVSVTGEENMEAVRKCLQEILDDVKESPVVDAVPVKHGKWIKFKCGYETHSNCSICNQTNTWGEVAYCPWCGARMDEDEID